MERRRRQGDWHAKKWAICVLISGKN